MKWGLEDFHDCRAFNFLEFFQVIDCTASTSSIVKSSTSGDGLIIAAFAFVLDNHPVQMLK